MPLLPDITTGALPGDDPDKKLDSMARQVNEWGRLLSNEKRTDITKDDSNTPRLLIGYQKDGFSNGNVGVKLSQEGVDVSAATDDELIWSSDFNMFKIAYTGTVTITSAAPSTTSQATVDLGATTLTKAPAFMAYTEFLFSGDLYSVQLPWSQTAAGSVGVIIFANTRIASGNLKFDAYITNWTGAPTGDYEVKYYIFKETAAPD